MFYRPQTGRNVAKELLEIVTKNRLGRLTRYISMENFLDLCQELTFDDVKIPTQRFLENGMSEQAAVRDIAHKELNHRGKLVNCLIESRGCLRSRSSPNCLPQVCVGLGVI